MTKRVGRNEPCPCGSGKKYKKCCWGKAFEFVEDDAGDVYRKIPMSNDLADALKEQEQHFVDTFGRKPGSGDKVFFDAPPWEHMEHSMVQTMRETGLRPDFVYAFMKTKGLIVTEENRSLIPDKDLQEWEAALDEYHVRYGEVLAIRLPWTRSEIKGKTVAELCDDARAATYLAEYREFVLTDPDTKQSLTQVVSGALADLPLEQFASLSKEQEGNIRIGNYADSLLRVLAVAQESLKVMDAVSAFEFSLFADDFVTSMSEKMKVASDDRIVKGLETVRTMSIGLFLIAMNQHFGFEEVPERRKGTEILAVFA